MMKLTVPPQLVFGQSASLQVNGGNKIMVILIMMMMMIKSSFNGDDDDDEYHSFLAFFPLNIFLITSATMTWRVHNFTASNGTRTARSFSGEKKAVWLLFLHLFGRWTSNNAVNNQTSSMRQFCYSRSCLSIDVYLIIVFLIVLCICILHLYLQFPLVNFDCISICIPICIYFCK